MAPRVISKCSARGFPRITAAPRPQDRLFAFAQDDGLFRVSDGAVCLSGCLAAPAGCERTRQGPALPGKVTVRLAPHDDGWFVLGAGVTEIGQKLDEAETAIEILGAVTGVGHGG
jgi:hypothetical protein